MGDQWEHVAEEVERPMAQHMDGRTLLARMLDRWVNDEGYELVAVFPRGENVVGVFRKRREPDRP